jgi:mono/diheme cytochrome c family protein
LRPLLPQQHGWKPLAIAAIAGAAFVAAAFAAVGLAIVGLGWFAVAASSPHSQLVYWITHTTMVRAVQAQSRSVVAPRRFTAAQVARGFRAYDGECVMCHGGPGVPRAAWVSGITPTPPYLLDAAHEWTPSQLKIIISNGLKMTAMPAWNVRHPDAQTWDIVAFVEHLRGMTPTRYAQMRRDLRNRTARAQNGRR